MSIESELAKRAVEITSPGSLKYYRYIIIGALILILIVGGIAYYAYHKHSEAESKLQQATVMTDKQAQDINYLQNALNESKQNAEMLAAAVTEAKAGQRQPEVRFVVQAPTVQVAAEKVAERINQGDKTLPPVAVEKTDRTIVVPNTEKTPQANWDVGVFKVNNYRNWEWSAGYGQHGGDKYMPVGLQRNFSKDAAASYERHFGGKMGYEVMYIRKTDKLFLLF